MKFINLCTFIENKVVKTIFIISVFIWIGTTFFIQLDRIVHLLMIFLMGNIAFIGYACKLNIKNNLIFSIIVFLPIVVGIFIVFKELITF